MGNAKYPAHETVFVAAVAAYADDAASAAAASAYADEPPPTQDWQVWTIWYEHRLDGRVREEERELAYVRIDESLWNQGPAIVNAEIARRAEGRSATSARQEKRSLCLAAKPRDTSSSIR